MLCLSYQKQAIMVYSTLFLFFTGIISTVKAVPRTRGSGSNRSISHDEVHNYLMEFGYLPKSDIETGNLRTEEQLKEAIRQLQRFGNVPVTGEIDDDTRKLIRKPRCGVPDKRDAPDFSSDNRRGSRRNKRFVIQGPKWETTDLTWSLVNQTMYTMNVGQVRRVLTEALSVWSGNSKLTFREVYSDEADIQVLFARRHHGDGYDFDGPGQVLAHAFYPGSERGGDAHFDEEEIWNLNGTHSAEGTNLMGVAVHEFGHSLGLGHSSVEDAIMYPWYHGYQINGDLPEDDRLAIYEIYGAKQKQWGPYRPNRPRTTTTTTTTSTTTRRTLVYYPDRKPPKYPENYPPKDPRYDPRQYPHHDPRYDDPRYVPRYDPRSDPRDPRYDPRFDPRDPRYDPRYGTQYPTNDPRYPEDPRRRNYPQHRPTSSPTYRPAAPTRRPEVPPTRRTYFTRPTTSTTTTTTTRATITYPRHKDHPRHKTPERPKKTKPDTCNISYDAISIIRGELFIFKDKYLWRIGSRGLYAGYPHEIRRLWKQLPENFTKVDAVYENRDRKIVFFIESEYYVFDSNTLEPGYPKPLTHLGLPPIVRKIDAALVWGHNKKTYFFSGTLYWRFDEDIGHVELDYPRDMSIWHGIGYHIDTAFQYLNGKTYFFKGKGFWEFDDSRMRVAHETPKSSAHKWMRCPRITNEIDEVPRQKEPLTSEPRFSTANHQTLAIKNKWHHFETMLALILLSPLFVRFSFS